MALVYGLGKHVLLPSGVWSEQQRSIQTHRRATISCSELSAFVRVLVDSSSISIACASKVSSIKSN